MGLTSENLADRYDDCTVVEVKALKRLTFALSSNPIIVNIGAGNRAISTLAFLEARPDALIFSVDIKVKENEKTYLKKAGLEWRRVIRVLGNSQVIGRRWPFGVDLVYVDGDHSFKGVRNDIAAWLPKVKPGGVMAFHDYMGLDGELTPAGRAVNKFVRGCDEILRVDRLVAFKVREK